MKGTSREEAFENALRAIVSAETGVFKLDFRRYVLGVAKTTLERHFSEGDFCILSAGNAGTE